MEYTDSWDNDFNTIKVFLMDFLKQEIIRIHHVGSTSVKGLGAKPIIDIDIEYEHGFETIKKLLHDHAYVYHGEQGIEGRHVFKNYNDWLPYHHLYVIHKDGLELKKHISFRDTLRKFPMYRNMYEEKKRSLIQANNLDRELYTNSKTDIITFIMKEREHMKTIVFAGGCFWGVEAYFKQLKGVVDTEVGYIGQEGMTTYQEVCNGSGHAEAVFLHYDENLINLDTLLDHLFNIIDPTSINKQGPDVGVQYRTGIYNYTPEEKELIVAYFKKKQVLYKKPIVVELETDLTFYKAEDYHQDYLDKNKHGYCHVDLGSYKNVK
jgi:methionine-S-sulfoxide reductase